MFALSIRELGDEEQLAKWLPQVKALKMIGCYAQTELGHGSNVAVSSRIGCEQIFISYRV